MSQLKRFLLLGSIGVFLLAGLMVTTNTKVSSTAFANGCNNPATGSLGSPYYQPTWHNNCTISEGNISNYVYAIQEIINTSGAGCTHLAVDGNFGPATFDAVKCYQKASGFPSNEQDGIVGPKTWDALAARPIVWGPNNGGWRNYSAPESGYIDFRMWITSGIWYVYAVPPGKAGRWCQMNLSSPC